MRWCVLVILIIAMPLSVEAPGVSEARNSWLPRETWQPDLPSHCGDGNGNEQRDIDEHRCDPETCCHMTLLPHIAELSISGLSPTSQL